MRCSVAVTVKGRWPSETNGAGTSPGGKVPSSMTGTSALTTTPSTAMSRRPSGVKPLPPKCTASVRSRAAAT